MSSLGRGLCPSRIGIALAAVLFLFAVAAADQATAASYWQCTNAWNQSDASNGTQCTGVAIKTQGETDCWVSAGCRKNNGIRKIAQFTGTPAEFACLEVNDGDLVVDEDC